MDIRKIRLKNIIIFLFLIFLTSCTKTQQQQISQENIPAISNDDVSVLTPEQVVILYFQAWNDKKYDVMYSLISDGFKQIEPTAKTFDEFKAYMEKFYDTALSVSIVEAKESYRTDKEAGIDYKIEITKKDGTKKELDSVYTLKKRANGWKLIHPYGENIDTS